MEIKDKEEKIVDIVERGFEGKKTRLIDFLERNLKSNIKNNRSRRFTIPFEFMFS